MFRQGSFLLMAMGLGCKPTVDATGGDQDGGDATSTTSMGSSHPPPPGNTGTRDDGGHNDGGDTGTWTETTGTGPRPTGCSETPPPAPEDRAPLLLAYVENISHTIAADLDNDGRDDLALLRGEDDGELLWLSGTDLDGEFRSIAAPDAVSMAVADLDGDASRDLMFSLLEPSDPPGAGITQIGVMLGLGDGGFAPMSTFESAGYTRTLILDDFSGDTIPDLITSGGRNDWAYSLLVGRGDGTFEPAVEAWDEPKWTSSRELRRFGRSGLAAVFESHDELWLRVVHGIDGSDPAVRGGVRLRQYTSGLGTGDFDGDGQHDLVMGVLETHDLRLYLGRGDGTFAEPFVTRWAEPSSALATGDLNNDGLRDLVVSGSGRARTFYGTPSGCLAPGEIYRGDARQPVLGHFDDDAWLDVVLPPRSGLPRAFLSSRSSALVEAAETTPRSP